MIDLFRGKYGFLSNMYDAPFYEDGIKYPTVEHYVNAAKTLDPNEKKRVMISKSPVDAKSAGKTVTLREDWDDVKLSIMEHAVRLKFQCNPKLAYRLIATGNEELVEGNWWHDTYWGVCNGVGENHLGKILMKIREELR